MTLPKHIAIIMDGNGRWAERRHHNRIFGHIKGAKAARDIIVACAELKIQHLTLFTFSTENWFRPKQEVHFLMKLLVRQLKKEKQTLIENNIRFRIIGDLQKLPKETRDVVIETIEETAHLTGTELTFALSYGGRQEICIAAKELAYRVQSGELSPHEIDEATFNSCLPSSYLPNPDLIIRTSGETRISNFFLWQSAYSELYFTPTLWPDFNRTHLQEALEFYDSKDRRYGRVSSHSPAALQTERLT